MIERFLGNDGQRRLRTLLAEQRIIGGDRALAGRFAELVKLRQLDSGEVLIEQGEVDNDLYFILTGTLTVLVNGRPIAERRAGSHVGEMALIDPATPRTATVIAIVGTVVASVSESDFSALAGQHSTLWRAIALELSQRLQERGRMLIEPNQTPILFIGSSTEGLGVAEALQKGLESSDLRVRLWSQGVFGASRFTIEDLEFQVQDSDFAVLVATADDVTLSRRKRKGAPRDNVIFELGLFMGALGRNRTYLVIPNGVDVKIPTDLLGLGQLRYESEVEDISDAVAPIVRELHILAYGLGSK